MTLVSLFNAAESVDHAKESNYGYNYTYGSNGYTAESSGYTYSNYYDYYNSGQWWDL